MYRSRALCGKLAPELLFVLKAIDLLLSKDVSLEELLLIPYQRSTIRKRQ
jgi:hypothetical protein